MVKVKGASFQIHLRPVHDRNTVRYKKFGSLKANFSLNFKVKSFELI